MICQPCMGDTGHFLWPKGCTGNKYIFTWKFAHFRWDRTNELLISYQVFQMMSYGDETFIKLNSWFSTDSDILLVMPPPLGAGDIMFSGCPSVRPSVRSLKYPLLTCTWVRWSTWPTVTVLRRVRPSVRLFVRPSVRRVFRAFDGERMEGMAWNFTCWCNLTIFRTN